MVELPELPTASALLACVDPILAGVGQGKPRGLEEVLLLNQKAILALARGCIKLFVTSVREHTGPIQLRLNHSPALVPGRERTGKWEAKRTKGPRLTYYGRTGYNVNPKLEEVIAPGGAETK